MFEACGAQCPWKYNIIHAGNITLALIYNKLVLPAKNLCINRYIRYHESAFPGNYGGAIQSLKVNSSTLEHFDSFPL